MQLAPAITLTATPGIILDGLPGIFQTVAIMRQLVNAGKINPEIRQAAASVAYLTPEKNDYAEVQAIFEYVRDCIRYLKDIHNVETLATPEKTMQCKYGDCDDQSVLLAALLESIGYPTRFVCAGYSDPCAVEHVYVQVACGDTWVNCDPTERQPLGYAPPGALCMYVENV